jgi:hypothetical protein
MPVISLDTACYANFPKSAHRADGPLIAKIEFIEKQSFGFL